VRNLKIYLSRFHKPSKIVIVLSSCILVLLLIFLALQKESQKRETIKNADNLKLTKELKKVRADLDALKNTDQVKRNDELESTIKNIQSTYNGTISLYENIVDLPSTSKDLPAFKKRFAKVLKYLADKNYASGATELATLKRDTDAVNAASLAALGGIDLSNIPANNAPPGSGFSRQKVDTNGSSFLVDLVAGNLSSTRVIVDSASDSDCRDGCPTLPLATYIARNGAYAGVNGSYFCPAEYPTCAGKTNSFDTLAMNVRKHYLNSDNNVYSTVPAVIFGSGFVRFIGRSSDWGRDTGVDGVLANQPLLVSGDNVTFGGNGDPKKGSRGNRSFVANKGNTVYIGVVHNVTVAESALVVKAMGMENSLNLDSGGSTALWAAGGYKAGPGRNIPNVILFVNK
jgi:hypothetical protein